MKVAALSLLAGLLRSSSASECGLSFADVEPCDQGYVTSECTQPAPSGDVTFTILHTNDVRGRVMPITRWSGDCVLESPTDPTSILERPSEYVGGCHGGVAARTNYILKTRAEVGADNTLLLDSGNYFFGSLWYANYKGASDVKYLENMAYDGMGAGSNEFFSGSIEYFNFLQAHPPSIVTTITNMNIENDPINNCKKQNAVNCVKPYDVIVKGGRKIGLLGFVPTDLFSIASPGPLLALYDYKAAAALAITALQTDHPDCKIIIALSQLQDEENQQLAATVAGIDIIVSGNHVNREAGDSETPYPTVRAGPGGKVVHQISSGHFGRRIGRHEITFDAAGEIKSFNADVSNSYKLSFGKNETSDEYLADSGDGVHYDDATVDPFNTWDKVREEAVYLEVNFKALVQGSTAVAVDGSKEDGEDLGVGMKAPEVTEEEEMAGAVRPLTDAETADGFVLGPHGDDFVATCSKDADTGEYHETAACCFKGTCFKGDAWWKVYGVRHSDMPMGRFATNAMMMECKDCTLALGNGGGIRSSLTVGDVTKGDLIDVFPYQNTLATVNLKGTDLRTIMEHSVAEYIPNDGEGKFLQVAGMRYVWNPLAADGNKIVSMEVCGVWDRIFNAVTNPTAGVCTGNWQKVEAQLYYKVGTNNFIAGGGDDFNFDQGQNMNEFGEQLEVMMQKYMDAVSPYNIIVGLELGTCTGEVNDFASRWAGEAECGADCQECRIFRSSGETELTCPSTDESLALCAAGSTTFMQDLTGTSNVCNGKACSGFGTCNNSTLTCECKPVEVDDFVDSGWADLVIDYGSGESACGAGFSMFMGDACEMHRTQWEFGSAGIVYITAIINLLACLFAIFWYQTNGKYAVVRLTQPIFHISSASGGVIASVGTLLLLPDNNTSSMCSISLLITGIGLMGMYGSIFAKTHRIDALMNNKRLKKVKVSQTDIFTRIMVFVIIEVVSIVALLIIAPVVPTVKEFNKDGAFQYTVTCSAGENTDMWVMVLCIVQFGLLGYGCYLAYRIRNVKGAMNEAFFIGISLYTSFLIGIVAIFVVLQSMDNPELVYMLGPAVINICCLVSVLSTLLPKVISLTDEMKAMTAEQAMKLDENNGTSTSGSNSTSAFSQEPSTPEEFFASIDEGAIRNAVGAAQKEQLAAWKAKCELIVSLCS